MTDRQTDRRTDRQEGSTNFIEKDATNYIKGIALVFMFIHHFFTFPDFYINGITYDYLAKFADYMCSPLKICVPIFAFLTGYFYYYSKNKTIRYSIKKGTDIWFIYIIVYIILLLPAILLGVYDFSISNFVLELFALKRPTMIFCWYVVFYITTMMILPLYAKLSEKFPCFSFFITLVLPTILSIILSKVLFGKATGLLQIVDNLNWFPSVGIGYLFAKFGIFFEFKSIIKTKKRIVCISISIVFITVAIVARRYGCPDFVCAPFFVFGIMEIYHNTIRKFIYKPIMIIGKYSLLMWFLHCIFFNQCKEYTQSILYFPKEPILVTIWGLLICLFASVIIQIPINLLLKFKNNIFKLDSKCKG